jgi:hypothetical protein
LTSKNLQELMKNLQVFYKCPSCGGGYRLNDIKFLGKVDDHCFMQLSCRECSLPVLATVFLSEGGQITGATPAPRTTKRRPKAAPTDLKAGEKTRFGRMAPISSSEIADFHLFLSSYKGSLAQNSTPVRKRSK